MGQDSGDAKGGDVEEAGAPETPPAPAPTVATTRVTRSVQKPDVSLDDRDLGWGEIPEDPRSRESWYERERPPHHEG